MLVTRHKRLTGEPRARFSDLAPLRRKRIVRVACGRAIDGLWWRLPVELGLMLLNALPWIAIGAAAGYVFGLMDSESFWLRQWAACLERLPR